MKTEFIEWLNTNSEDFQFILFGVLLISLIIVEIIIPFRKNKAMKKGRWWTNFLLTLLNIMVLSAMPVSFISASMIATEKHWGVLNQFQIPFLPALFLTLFLRGFISFFTHFLMHKIPLLWRLHRVHHLDTEMDVTTTVRFHPLEFVVSLVIGIPIIILIGFSSWALLFYELFDVAITLISHSNISFPKKIDRFIRYIIVTPDLHRVHHSSHQPETDSNFSAVFPVWDIIFGTFRTNTRVNPKEMEMGLEEVRDKRTNNLFWLLKSPFISFASFSRNKREEKDQGVSSGKDLAA